MKKIQEKIYYVLMMICIMLPLTMPSVGAEKKIFHGTGEYTMSDYETPAVAEQRALSYAKQQAAEQAGAYVETYTRMEKVQVTEDRVNVLVSGAMAVINQNIEKKAMSDGDVRIVANITVEVDSNFFDKDLSEDKTNSIDNAVQLSNIKQAIAKEEKETQELKGKITELKNQNLPVKDFQIKAKEQENIFLANQKLVQSVNAKLIGDINTALLLVNEVLMLNPKSDNAYNLRGCIYCDNREYDKAINDFNMALIIETNFDNPYNNRAIAYINKGEYDKAISDSNRALSIKPSEEAYINRGVAYGRKNEYDKAISDFNMALQINKKAEYAYINRGAAYGMKGEHDKAISDFNKALQINPKSISVYNGRGMGYLKKVNMIRQ